MRTLRAMAVAAPRARRCVVTESYVLVGDAGRVGTRGGDWDSVSAVGLRSDAPVLVIPRKLSTPQLQVAPQVLFPGGT